MTLSKRKLGTQGLEVSAIGLGCMGMSQSYGLAAEGESIVTLHRAIDLGCTFFDTAQGYGPLTNEELLGRAFKGRRAQVVIGTKRRTYLEENVAAATIQLDSTQMRVLDAALAPGNVSRQRYAEWIMATIDR